MQFSQLEKGNKFIMPERNHVYLVMTTQPSKFVGLDSSRTQAIHDKPHNTVSLSSGETEHVDPDTEVRLVFI